MIEFRNVTKVYDSNKTKALDDVNIRIEDGEFVFVVGSSGAGKSTLLKLIMHEEKPTEGEVIVGDYSSKTLKKKQVPYYRRNMGIVFQDFRLISNMTVYDNVAFAMRVIGEKEKNIRKRVPYILQLVGLGPKVRAYPDELSGGEQQRVSLARALVNNPKLLIADEPTGNIDPAMSHEIVEMFTKINNNGTTVLMVTHEHNLVKAFNKRVIVIKNGRVVSDTPDPTHAKFESEDPVKDTNMYYFSENTALSGKGDSATSPGATPSSPASSSSPSSASGSAEPAAAASAASAADASDSSSASPSKETKKEEDDVFDTMDDVKLDINKILEEFGSAGHKKDTTGGDDE